MAKGILGRKLGMTQVFDPDTGAVTSVTVIEAGPCPVVQVKTLETDGYDAVQLAFDAVPERKLTRPELGHLKRFGVGPHRKLVEFRGAIDGAVEGETVTVETFEPGDAIKVAGIGIGKGFQGTIKRHNFSSGPRSHGSHNIRKPGSIGASATPSRVFKGIKMAGRMGGKRVTQVGLTVHEVDVERNLLLVKGSVPGPKNGIVGGAGLMAAPTAPLLDAAGAKAKDVDARGRRVRRRGQAAPRPRGRARRAERAPRGHVRDEEPRARLRRPRQAVAPEGHRPRRARAPSARRSSRAAATPSRRCRARSSRRSTARPRRPRCARRSRATSQAGSLALHRRAGVRGAVDEDGEELPRDRRARHAGRARRSTDDETNAAKSFRNLERVAIVAPSELEVSAVVWARSLVVSEAALPLVQTRASEGATDA